MRRFFSTILIALFLASCYHEAPEAQFDMTKVIPADSMVSLLTDLHIADGVIAVQKKDKTETGHLSTEYFNEILKKHNIDRETFEESMRYYAYHTDQLDDIYEKVITELNKKESLYLPKKDNPPPPPM